MTEIGEIVKSHEAPLIRYAARILCDRDCALDAVQETFIKLVRISQAGRMDKIGKLKPWLYKVTRNYCFDQLKSARKKFEMHLDISNMEDLPLEESSEGPDAAAEREDSLQHIRGKIAELKPSEKEVVLLKLEHGKSYKEIAYITGLSVGNVGFILHHAMKRLAEGLRNELQ